MNLSIGTQYKFTLISNPFIGSEHIGKLISICDHAMAMMIMDVSQIHINIYASLPAGVNRDPKTLEYLVIQTADTSKIVIAKQWLANDPEVILKITRQYTIEFNTNEQRVSFEQLAADYGFNIIGNAAV